MSCDKLKKLRDPALHTLPSPAWRGASPLILLCFVKAHSRAAPSHALYELYSGIIELLKLPFQLLICSINLGIFRNIAQLSASLLSTFPHYALIVRYNGEKFYIPTILS